MRWTNKEYNRWNLPGLLKWMKAEYESLPARGSKKEITLKLSDYFLLQHILSAVEDDVTIMNIGVFKYIYPL